MRGDYPPVTWANYSYGYEARLVPNGRAFARARMVRDVPGIRYELIWIYGPKHWRPLRVGNIMRLERQVERYVKHHRAHILSQLPRDPLEADMSLEDLSAPLKGRPARLADIDTSLPYMASWLRVTGMQRHSS